jgi:ABC-2 type transport system ATP-binding protein
VEEVQDVLTDLMFIDRGLIALECSMEEFESRYLEVMVNPEHVAAARALKPIHERSVFGRSVMLFDGANREQVGALGEVRRPSIADLFVAVMSGPKDSQNQRSEIGRQRSEATSNQPSAITDNR